MTAMGARAGTCSRRWRGGPRRACGVGLLIALLGACALDRAVDGAMDDILSYKSLVLGSLSSGERVSGRVSGRRDLRLFEL